MNVDFKPIHTRHAFMLIIPPNPGLIYLSDHICIQGEKHGVKVIYVYA
jgi:hypothetical protein